jgi:hypothetical protein
MVLGRGSPVRVAAGIDASDAAAWALEGLCALVWSMSSDLVHDRARSLPRPKWLQETLSESADDGAAPTYAYNRGATTMVPFRRHRLTPSVFFLMTSACQGAPGRVAGNRQ